MTKSASLLMVLFLLSSCMVPRADISPEGYLEIYGPSSALSKNSMPPEWFVEGLSKQSLSSSFLNVDTLGGSPALNISAASTNYIFAKRTKATLLATPYLNWSWNIPAFEGSEYPVRLLIGFYGGNPQSGSWGSQPLVYLGKTAPPYDRAISIIWHRNALLRGTFSRTSINPNSKKFNLPKYIARGGLENTDQWFTENIDLSALYRNLWPQDEHRKVQIMFVGFAATKSRTPDLSKSSAAIADFILTK